MCIWSLGWKDPLEEGMAKHSLFLPGESHLWAPVHGLQRVRHDWSDLAYMQAGKDDYFRKYCHLLEVTFENLVSAKLLILPIIKDFKDNYVLFYSHHYMYMCVICLAYMLLSNSYAYHNKFRQIICILP